MKRPVLLTFIILLLSCNVHANNETQDELSQIFNKAMGLFNEGELITPTPVEVDPNGVKVENQICVKRDHDDGIAPIGTPFNYNNYSHAQSNFKLITVDKDLLIGNTIYVGGRPADYYNGEYSWQYTYVNSSGGTNLSSFRLRRVRIANPPTSINEFWVSISHWGPTYNHFRSDTVCYSW